MRAAAPVVLIVLLLNTNIIGEWDHERVIQELLFRISGISADRRLREYSRNTHYYRKPCAHRHKISSRPYKRIAFILWIKKCVKKILIINFVKKHFKPSYKNVLIKRKRQIENALNRRKKIILRKFNMARAICSKIEV